MTTDTTGAPEAEALAVTQAKAARIAAARKKLAEEAPALSRAAWNYVFNGRRT